ncbi:BTAD domain-containing putative transcriptional regulator [Dactylosporangium sp. NPDC000521]|uniref:BTAD domain-containing putative transcriptional regulator n=1 Tax=Dactylosporangium sp. NPDC000521 TaxID=3363975 RepID=UPI00368759BA
MIRSDDAWAAPFGELLRTHREAAALTQRELAERAGISAAAVRDLEQRRTLYPQAASVRSLSEALGLTGPAAEAFRQAAIRPTAPPAAPPVAAGPDGDAARAARILVLGPLVVSRDEAAVPFGSERQRTLLGRLALTPNEAVPRGELIDLLWPDGSPDSAVNLVQTYVTRLRRLLTPAEGSGGTLHFGPAGYLLRVGPAELDLLRFRGAVEQARPARPAVALELLVDALAVWRGAPAGDVGALAGHPRAVALTNERLQAAVRLADLADQLGDHVRAVTPLQALSEEHPLHEPVWGRLILALAASGLQAAALAAYEQIRGRLADELGIDPGPELAGFHRRVLRQQWTASASPAASAVRPAPPAASLAAPPPVPSPRMPAVVSAPPVPSQRMPTVVSAPPVPTPNPPMPAPGAAPAPLDRVRPLQVPAPVGDFTGRSGELMLLCELLRDERDPGSPAPVKVCAIAGPGGVGKTSLAVQAAHLMRADFTDGQLYADLHGDGAHPARPVDVLSQSLRALGVAAALIPTEEAECSALYRTTLADRRILIVLDNARDARQIRPLLPGAGACSVIVTSRRRMLDLEAATTIDLETMPVDEAVDLLAKIAGPARVLDDPEATAAIVRLCGHLPLAVRIAGARLVSRPNWTVDLLARRLDDEVRRLDELRAGDLQVGASFRLSYQDLAQPAARAFRLLAVAPIDDWSVPAAAALLGARPHDAEDLLDDLVDCSLLLTPAPGRYTFHDLLRLYARNLSLTEDGPLEQTGALERLFAYYLDRIVEAARIQHPNMVRLPDGDAAGSAHFADCDAALAWLDVELPQIVSIVEHAARRGPRSLAWIVADQLRGYFFSSRQATQWFATGRAGLEAAQQAGDLRAQAAMYQTLGQASWSIGDFRQSLEQYRLGLALAERTGWHPAVGYISHNIGLVHLALGEPEAAQQAYLEALAVCRRHQHEYVEAVTLNDLGMMCWELGRLKEAANHLALSLALNERGGNIDGEGINRHNLGLVLRELGDFDEARVQLERSLEIHQRTGSRYAYACGLEQLALVHAAAGQDHDTAIGLARAGLELMRSAQDRSSQAGLLVSLGALLFDAGHDDEAAQCTRDAYAIASAIGAPYLQTRALIGLVAAHLRDGETAAAAQAADTALDLARRGGYRMLEIDALVARAHACGDRDLYRTALRLSTDAGARERAVRIERLLGAGAATSGTRE